MNTYDYILEQCAPGTRMIDVLLSIGEENEAILTGMIDDGVLTSSSDQYLTCP